MHHDSIRREVIVVGAGLLIATLACGVLPGRTGDSGAVLETAPETAEESVEGATKESTPETVPPAATTAAPAPAVLATGDYTVSGTNPDSSVYEGMLRITQDGNVYGFDWEVGTVFVGEGIQRGDKVAVAYPADDCQIALYDISPDGTLVGDWVSREGTGFGTEVATPTGSVSGGAVDGTYDYAGTAPDGKNYEGTMTVSASGDLYTVAQQEAGSTGGPIVSVGIMLGQSFAMSYGPDVPEGTCGVVLYAVEPDGSLDGVWGTFGVSTQMGTEVASPQ